MEQIENKEQDDMFKPNHFNIALNVNGLLDSTVISMLELFHIFLDVYILCAWVLARSGEHHRITIK